MSDSTTREVVKVWLRGLPAAERESFLAEVRGDGGPGDGSAASGPAGGPAAPAAAGGATATKAVPKTAEDGRSLYDKLHPRGHQPGGTTDFSAEGAYHDYRGGL